MVGFNLNVWGEIFKRTGAAQENNWTQEREVQIIGYVALECRAQVGW